MTDTEFQSKKLCRCLPLKYRPDVRDCVNKTVTNIETHFQRKTTNSLSELSRYQ